MTTINTLIGVGLGVAGGTIQSIGFIAQKQGHNQINKINEDKSNLFQKSVLTQWIWWVGIAVYTIGGAMDSTALNFAAQSIISPLSAIKLGTIALLSYFILKEKLSIKDIIAILIIIIGIIIVVSFGPSSDSVNSTIDELREYFKGPPYIITVIFLILITVLDFIAVKFVERKNFNDDKNDDITFGSNFLLFSYVWIGCFFASNNTLFIKASVSIIISSIASSDDFKTNATDYLSYIIIALFVICMFSMEYFRQKALSHFGALYVVPTFTVISIILTAVIGMIFFEEYQNFTLENAMLFILGIIITICGVLVLSFDIAKIWTNLYDEYIKVAFIDYDTADIKYPQTVVYGGPTSEYLAYLFLKRPAICNNREYDVLASAEQMIGKGTDDIHKNTDNDLEMN